MDNQADKLRELVRAVRHAAAVNTGPLTMAIYTADDGELAFKFEACLASACRERGIATNASSADWQLVQLAGAFDVSDQESWQRASVLIVVTYGDDQSIVDCYRGLKVAADHTPLPPLEVIVVADDLDEGRVACERLAATCKRFLHCSMAGTTCCEDNDDLLVASIQPLVNRLMGMAPMGSGELHSPIAVHGSQPL